LKHSTIGLIGPRTTRVDLDNIVAVNGAKNRKLSITLSKRENCVGVRSQPEFNGTQKRTAGNNTVNIDFQAVLVAVQDAANRGVANQNVIRNLETGRVANDDGGDGQRVPNMSKGHVSSVFDDVIDDEDADSTVVRSIARLLTEVAIASKHDGYAVVHVELAALAGAVQRALARLEKLPSWFVIACVDVGSHKGILLPAVGTARKHEGRSDKRHVLILISPQLHSRVSVNGAVLKVGDDLQIVNRRREISKRAGEHLPAVKIDLLALT